MPRHGATSGPDELPRSAAAAPAAGLGPLRHVATTGSTNSDLVAEARAGDAGACVLVADHQTAGRGRLDREWEDRGGALLVSIRCPVTAAAARDLAAAGHDFAAAVAAGARAALADRLPVTVEIKWPNDLVVADGSRPGKLAGVLGELVETPHPAVVVGLGCNLEPIDSQPESTSVRACGGVVDRDAVLADVLEAVGARRTDPAQVHDEHRRHSATLGARVRVEVPGRAPVVGEAVALGRDGRLTVVDDDGHRHLVATGDVLTVRPHR